MFCHEERFYNRDTGRWQSEPNRKKGEESFMVITESFSGYRALRDFGPLRERALKYYKDHSCWVTSDPYYRNVAFKRIQLWHNDIVIEELEAFENIVKTA